MFRKKFGHLLFCINFTPKFQTHPSLGNGHQSLKVVLAEKKRTNKWLAQQPSKASGTISK